MKIVEQGYEILAFPENMLELIEIAGRNCYQSAPKGSPEEFVKILITRGHEAMIEHGGMITVKFICDRAIANEIERHRLFSFAAASTRYINFYKRNNMEFICPPFVQEDKEKYKIWHNLCTNAEKAYDELINISTSPEIARAVLPLSLATQVIVSGNIREWRHFFELRTARDAHPQIRELATKLLEDFKQRVPVLFDDISGV